MAELRWRYVALDGAMTFAGNAALPRLAHRLRWPTRAGPRGVLVYVAFRVLASVLLRVFVARVERSVQEQQRLKDALRHELGREPTDQEVFERYLASRDA